MANKGGSSKTYQLPGLRRALGVVETLGKQMHGESMADYKVARSASAAGQANLAKQTRALTRDLVAGQRQNAAAIGRLSDRARASQRQVRAKQANSVSRYGSALGASAASQFGQARATATAGAKVVGGQAKASKGEAAIAGTVAGFAGQEVQAQQAAAKYSLNQALQQRNIIDNQTLAGLTEDLYKQGLAYNSQMQMYEQQRADAAKDAKKAELAQTRDTLGFLQQSTPEIGAWMQNAMQTNADALQTDGQWDVTKIRDAYAAHVGIDPASVAPGSQDATRLDVVLGIAREVQGGADIPTATDSALNTLYGGMPGWDKMAPTQIAAIQSGIGAANEATVTQNLATIGQLSVSEGGSALARGPLNPGNWAPTGGPGTQTQFRDAGAAYVMQTYGHDTARAWVRGQTNWSDSAIDSYLSMLPSDATSNYNFSDPAQAAPAPISGAAPGATGRNIPGSTAGSYG